MRKDFAELTCTEDDSAWLRKKCPFLQPEYLDYLKSFRLKPDQVKVTFFPSEDDADKGRLEISATGPWVETILWEVPLMACLSELYFLTTDRDWTYEGQRGVCTCSYQRTRDLTLSRGTKKRLWKRRRGSLRRTYSSASLAHEGGGHSILKILSSRHSSRRRRNARRESLWVPATYVVFSILHSSSAF